MTRFDTLSAEFRPRDCLQRRRLRGAASIGASYTASATSLASADSGVASTSWTSL